jgi:hypothetical protein
MVLSRGNVFGKGCFGKEISSLLLEVGKRIIMATTYFFEERIIFKLSFNVLFWY